MFEKFIKLFSFILLFASAGCASHSQMYAGRKLPLAEVSTLSGTGVSSGPLGYGYTTMQILFVDNTETKRANMIENSVELLPGRRKIEIGCYNVETYANAEFEFEFLAGHNYQIRFKEAEGRTGFNSLHLESAWLHDTTIDKPVLSINSWSDTKKSVFIMPTTIYIN